MKKIFFMAAALLSVAWISAAVSITAEGGWLETAYAEWAPMTGATSYNVYVRAQGGTYQQIDEALVRRYNYAGTIAYRADALGLQAGNYQLKVVPVVNNGEVAADAAETAVLQVASHDRNGFAHFAYTQGVGAYTDQGTLKPNTVVLYVSSATAKTVQMDVKTSKTATTPCTGLQTILDAYQKGYETRPLCVRVLGMVSLSDMDHISSSEEGLQIKGREADAELHITLEGVGRDALLKGFGVLVRNAKSVEIRNLGVMTDMDDCISLDTDNDHIWVHHIDGFYGHNGGGDHIKGDGTIDVKTNSKHVTVSYNHFFDTGKSTMCGMKGETGPNYVTYHHNWFDHSDSRHPRIRTMSVHIYNNLYEGISKYGVGVTSGASAFVEANSFVNCPRPMLISMQGTDTKNGTDLVNATTFSKEDGGIIKAYNNNFSGTKTYVPYSSSHSVEFDAYEVQNRTDQVPATVTARQGGTSYDNFDTNSAVMYSVTPEAPANVSATVKGNLGAGRCQHGDVDIQFTAADNASYDLNQALVSLIDNYTSALDSVFGQPSLSASSTTSGDSTGVTPGEGSFECYFTGGQPSSSFYTITGSYTNSKGSVEVNGTTYDWALKLESATNITFTLAEANTIYLVFGGTDATKFNIKVDGTKLSADATTHVLTCQLAAGKHELTKGDSGYLFYMNMTEPYTPSGLEDVSESNEKATKVMLDGRVYIQVGNVRYSILGQRF